MKVETHLSSAHLNRKEEEEGVAMSAEVAAYADEVFPLIGESNALHDSAQSLRQNTVALGSAFDIEPSKAKVAKSIQSSENPFSRPQSKDKPFHFGSEKEVLTCLQQHPLITDSNLPKTIAPVMAKMFANQNEEYLGIARHVATEIENNPGSSACRGVDLDASDTMQVIDAVRNCARPPIEKGDGKKYHYGSEDTVMHCLEGHFLTNPPHLLKRGIPQELANAFAYQRLDSEELGERMHRTMIEFAKEGRLPAIDGIEFDMRRAVKDCASVVVDKDSN